MLSVCAHDCPSACSLVVSVENGRVTDVAGNPEHPFTQGVICGKVRAYAERVHSELRVRTPLRRRGPKGAGEFVRVSWDEAIEEIVRRWRAIMAEDGGEAILPFSYAGTMGQVQYYAGHPLFHALGATREARSNWEALDALARSLGVAADHYAKTPETLIRELLATGDDSIRGITYERLREEGSVRLNLPRPYLPFAHGAPTPSGKVEFYSERLAAAGHPPLPTYVPLSEGPDNRELAARYPLQCIVPPNRFFLNSSFSQSERLRRRQGGPVVLMAAEDAERRAIADGDAVRVFNDRGAAQFTARVTDATRAGVVVAEGLWWHRFQPGGRSVNVVTSDRVADLGGGPAFHSTLVQIARLSTS
jgi:anaerobic selenocysteine-containing dehydrogenase